MRLSLVNCSSIPRPEPVRMMATRSPSCICSPTKVLSVSRASAMLEGESPISSTINAMVRRTSSGAICRVGMDSGAADRIGLLFSGRLAFHNRQADVREMSEMLFLPIHQQFEIAFVQIFNVFAILVDNDGVHLHELCADTHHFLPRSRRGRILRRILGLVGRRLLRKPGSGDAGEQCGGENKNDRSLKSEHRIL